MMRSASYTESSYASGGSPRRRLLAAALAIGVNVLLILVLLNMAGVAPLPKDISRMVVFGIQKEQPSAQKQERKAAKSARKAAATAAVAPSPVRTTPTRKATQQPKTPFDWSQLGVMNLNRQEYAASDVGKIAPHPAEQAGAGQGQQADAGAGDSEVVGKGPNGEPLYAAEWYREPTDAELSTYVQNKAMPGAWADIACRTVARFHVDDCVELADSPPGSHLAGAIRQAAFQFLVRPPRVGGKALLGVWVRIRITFSEGARRR